MNFTRRRHLSVVVASVYVEMVMEAGSRMAADVPTGVGAHVACCIVAFRSLVLLGCSQNYTGRVDALIDNI